jgi:hypothetical protein
MVVTLSCLARSTARSLGIPEPEVKRARLRPYREHDDPKFRVVWTELDDGTSLRLNCCHHDHGQIVSLSEA